MSFINLKNVVKVYPDGTQAIFNSSLSIEKGELVVFVAVSYTHLTLPTICSV